MRLLRRGACAVALATATPLLVSGCGGGGSAAGSNELHVLVGANADYPKQLAQWEQDLKQKFKARTGANLVFETFSDSSDETTKIETSMVSGTGPDVFQLGTTFTPVAYGTHGFATLSPQDWKKIGGRGRYVNRSLAMSGPDPAHQIGVPTGLRPYGIVYNKQKFAAVGIKEPPATWDELIADAKKLTDRSSGTYGLAQDYADSYDPWKYTWAFAEQTGGALVSKNGAKAQLDSPQMLKATDSYFNLLTKDHVADPASAGWDASKAIAAFANGKAAILPMVTPTVIPSLNASSVKGKYAFAPLPTVPPGMSRRPAGGVAASSIVSGDDLAIAKYADKPLALQFVNLATSKPMQLEQWKLLGNIPSNRQAAAQLSGSDPDVAAFLKAEDSSVATPFTGAFADIENGLLNVAKQSLPDLSQGTYSPSKVSGLLRQANSTAQSSINRSRR